METLELECKECGATEEIGGVTPDGGIYGAMLSAAFLTVHLNGCHQIEVLAGNPPHLSDIFAIKEATK